MKCSLFTNTCLPSLLQTPFAHYWCMISMISYVQISLRGCRAVERLGRHLFNPQAPLPCSPWIPVFQLAAVSERVNSILTSFTEVEPCITFRTKQGLIWDLQQQGLFPEVEGDRRAWLRPAAAEAKAVWCGGTPLSAEQQRSNVANWG